MGDLVQCSWNQKDRQRVKIEDMRICGVKKLIESPMAESLLAQYGHVEHMTDDRLFKIYKVQLKVQGREEDHRGDGQMQNIDQGQGYFR